MSCNKTPPTGGDDRPAPATAADYVPLAMSLAGRFAETMPELADDYESAAMLGLAKASAAYRPDEYECGFAKFAEIIILNEIRLAYRRGIRRTPVSLIDGEPVAPGRPPGAELEDRDQVAALLAQLPPSYAEALRLTYLEGHDLAAAAGLAGCTVDAMRVRKCNALARLRKASA